MPQWIFGVKHNAKLIKSLINRDRTGIPGVVQVAGLRVSEVEEAD